MKKKNKLENFVALRRDMLASPDWRRLSPAAKVIYVYMKLNANNEISNIKLTHGQLHDMFSWGTISRGFRELQEAGFIEQIFKGGKFGSPAVYKFVGPFASPWQSGRKH